MPPELSIVHIEEQDENVVHGKIQTARGPVTVMANKELRGSTLMLTQVHVEGQGLTMANIRQSAREIGRLVNVETVVIQGGVRTSGAHPRSVPRPITVRVS